MRITALLFILYAICLAGCDRAEKNTHADSIRSETPLSGSARDSFDYEALYYYDGNVTLNEIKKIVIAPNGTGYYITGNGKMYSGYATWDQTGNIITLKTAGPALTFAVRGDSLVYLEKGAQEARVFRKR